jgi:hypothetical protein
MKRITGADIPENLWIQSLETIQIIGKTSEESLLFIIFFNNFYLYLNNICFRLKNIN